MMFPLFSILRNEGDFAWPPHQFVLLHLKRVHLMEWARAVIATTLGLLPGQPLPPVIMQQEQDDVMKQIREFLTACELPDMAFVMERKDLRRHQMLSSGQKMCGFNGDRMLLPYFLALARGTALHSTMSPDIVHRAAFPSGSSIRQFLCVGTAHRGSHKPQRLLNCLPAVCRAAFGGR